MWENETISNIKREVITIKEVYLDNSATTRPTAEVMEAFTQASLEYYGNPSSLHRKGLEAERLLKSSRRQMADALQINEKELYFTSGGTEANNLAILGSLPHLKHRGTHLITSAIEHPSVLKVYQHLEQNGYQVTYLPVNRDGVVDLTALEAALDRPAALVSIMGVNNETGAIQPVVEIGQMLASLPNKPVFHIDAVQALGKMDFNIKKTRADIVTFSGHKFHSPRGIGGLYLKQPARLAPRLLGGNQENGLKPGTENLPGIHAMSVAARAALGQLSTNIARFTELNTRLRQGIAARIEKVRFNSPEGHSAPHILNVSFDGIRGEVLLHALESDSIYVSTGSACTSRKQQPSHVLQALGLTATEMTGAIRFSFNIFNTAAEVDFVVERLTYHVAALRRIING